MDQQVLGDYAEMNYPGLFPAIHLSQNDMFIELILFIFFGYCLNIIVIKKNFQHL